MNTILLMFTPEISLQAAMRWKRNQSRQVSSRLSTVNDKKLRDLISTQNVSRFISTPFTPGYNTPKISRNEEVREVSLQLVHLKKKHDLSKKHNYTIQQLLDKNSKIITKCHSVETKTAQTTENISKQAEKLEKAVEDIKEKQDEALSARKIYKHMYNRMKISKIKLEEQSLQYNLNFKFTDQIYNEEVRKSRKAKESNKEAKSAFSVLTEFVFHETKEKYERVQIASKDTNQQLKNSKNREFRIKRQYEIAEAAADDDRNNTAMQIREGLMVHRLLYFLLNVKFENSKKKFAIIDDAFRRVKNTYGAIEPLEMIEKMLVKEQTYSDLLASIGNNKKKIEQQKQKNEEIDKKIEVMNALKLQNLDPNLFWREELARLNKDLVADQEKLYKVRIVHEKIQLWAGRNLKKIGVEKEFESLKDLFDEIKGFIKRNVSEKSKNALFANKNRVDGMKVEEVLKLYIGEEGRRRTFSAIPDMSNEGLLRELSVKDEEEKLKR